MESLNCIIIEDNPLDAALLQSFIATEKLLKLRGTFSNVLEANTHIREYAPELIFMDIDMPVMNGMDYYRNLNPQPLCIFVTAHSEFAWEGFEAQAFDFILKPVRKNRFQASMSRLSEYLELQQRADLYDTLIEENTLTIKEGSVRHIIQLRDILYIEALKDYSKVVTSAGKIMTLSKLKHFLDQLPPDQFVRIHRSYAVSIHHITRVLPNELYIGVTKLPVGKTYKNQLKQFL